MFHVPSTPVSWQRTCFNYLPSLHRGTKHVSPTCHPCVSALNIFDERSTRTSTTAPLSIEIWSSWWRLLKSASILAILTSRLTDVSAMLRNSTFDGTSIGCRSIGLSKVNWKACINSLSRVRAHGSTSSRRCGSTFDANICVTYTA